MTLARLLEEKGPRIAELCARHGVARLAAFGSVLREDVNPETSDLDLLVEFQSMESYARVEAYFGLLDDLRALFSRKIDLVMTAPRRTATSRKTSSARRSCCMPRDERAYLTDIVESCAVILHAVRGLSLTAYQATGSFARPWSGSSSSSAKP